MVDGTAACIVLISLAELATVTGKVPDMLALSKNVSGPIV
jgi:hypothetical protein